MIRIEDAKKMLRRLGKCRVMVLGDLMLDRYISGSVSRISPEAPVPVLRVQQERGVPGGAANVAKNIRALGGQAVLAGVVGRDAPGRELMALLRAAGIQTAGVVPWHGCQTIVKTRVLADRHQIVRVDWEDAIEQVQGAAQELCRRIPALVEESDGVIIEDYGKGVVSQAVVDATLEAAKKFKRPVGLDPKDTHKLSFDWLTLATPNYAEACAAAGVQMTDMGDHPLKNATLARAAAILQKKWQCRLMMITLGPHGMYLMEENSKPKVIPTRAREVYDVCGAGDTVIAATLLALSAGVPYEQSALLANYAAGVVVGKVGTATCTPDELVAYIEAEKAVRK